jgi:hypothetical protein
MLADFVHGVVILTLGLWFAVSCLTQTPFRLIEVRFFPRILIPQWHFFAPRPGTIDLTLCYRNKFPTGELSSWREIELGARRRWFSFIWNPHRRIRKALFDLAVAFATEHQRSPETARISIPYLMLMNLVTHYPHCPGGSHAQFCVLIHDRLPKSDSRELFLSSDMFAI